MKKLSIQLTFILILLTSGLIAQKLNFENTSSTSIGFTENKGQLADENGSKLSSILFYGGSNETYVYLEKNKLKFVQAKGNYVIINSSNGNVNVGNTFKRVPEKKISSVDYDRIELELLNANSNPEIIPSRNLTEKENFYAYYIGKKGLHDVRTYDKVTYKNIYPNIDLVLECKTPTLLNNQMEYSFVVHPGGNVRDIQMKWNGMFNKTTVTHGGFIYTTSLGQLSESNPVCFQEENKAIKSSFISSGNLNTFSVEAYDVSKDLIIDPTLTWATYYGTKEGTGVTTWYNIYSPFIGGDANGNIYITNATNSYTGMATKGAFSTVGTSIYSPCIYLAKFDSAGNRIWSTYVRGRSSARTGEIWVNGLATDGISNLYIAGPADDDTSFITKGSYINTPKYDTSSFSTYSTNSFIAKFDTSGYRIWAGFFTGAGTTSISAIALDSKYNVVIAGGTTVKDSLIPKGSYQDTYQGDGQTYIAKFDSSGSKLLWATYSYASVLLFTMTIGGNDDIYIAGANNDTINRATTGTFISNIKSIKKGSGDHPGYIAKYRSSGQLAWYTYVNQTNDCEIYRLTSDKQKYIYTLGWTETSSGLASKGAFQTSGGYNAQDMFISKFDSTGQRAWCTYYGGNDGDAPYDIEYRTEDHKFFVTGYSESKGMATKGAYKTALEGVEDGLISEWDSSGKRLWASYYGGSRYSLISNTFTDSFHHIIIAGETTSTDSIATPGAFQTKYTGVIVNGNYIPNDFIARFNEPDTNGCNSKPLISGSKNACINNNSKIYSTSTAAKSYTWFANGGTIVSGRNNDSVTVKWDNTHTAKNSLRLVINRVNGCMDSNTFSVVMDTIPHAAFSSNTACLGDSTFFTNTSYVNPTTTSSYYWTLGDGGFSSKKAPSHLYSLTSGITTKLKITDNNGCIDSASNSVNISSNCVWPGDANYDKIVTVKDLLNIGVGYGKTGPARSAASVKWYPQPCTNWKDTFTGTINYKQADCNGDSTINSSDTLAIVSNYSKTHLKTFSMNQGKPTDPPLYLQFSKDTAMAGDVVRVDIMYGSKNIPVTNAYGVSFSLLYNASLVQSLAPDFKSSWLASKPLSLAIKPNAGQFDIGTVRTNHTDTSGNGIIASFYTKITNTIPKGTHYLTFSFVENFQSDSILNYQPAYLINDSIYLTIRTGINSLDLSSFIKISPNPASSKLKVAIEAPEKDVYHYNVYSVDGRSLLQGKWSLDEGENNYTLNLEDIPSGIYLLSIQNKNGIQKMKFIKQ